LSPFHYFGVTDLTINGNEIEEKAEFNLLTSNERVTRIIEQSQFYNCDDGNIRGLVFVQRLKRQKNCQDNLISVDLNQFLYQARVQKSSEVMPLMR